MTKFEYIKENCASVLVQYSNGLVDAMFNGTDEISDILDHCLRLHYLWGVLSEIRESGGLLYVGDTELSGASLASLNGKIWHYNGIFSDVDLSDYTTVVTDDGDSGTCVPGTDSTTDDHYRAGEVAVSAGSGTVTFIKNGVASPLASSNYRLTVYVKTASGYEQRNIVVSAKYASGFVYDDVLEAGTLNYVAELDT